MFLGLLCFLLIQVQVAQVFLLTYVIILIISIVKTRVIL